LFSLHRDEVHREELEELSQDFHNFVFTGLLIDVGTVADALDDWQDEDCDIGDDEGLLLLGRNLSVQELVHTVKGDPLLFVF